jgi:hypothetical protein
MRISTNNIGNYGPQTARGVQQQAKTNEKFELPKTANLENKTMITPDEKSFFAGLYPNNKTEIENHFYSKSGKMSGVKVGSLINRRG